MTSTPPRPSTPPGGSPAKSGQDGQSSAASSALGAAVERYHDILSAYVEKGGEDHRALLDRMVVRGAVFAGRPICSFLRPHFLLRSQHAHMVVALRHLKTAVSKARDTILADPKLLELMGLTDGERRLLSYSPDFKSFGVITRLDTILSGDRLSLVELNAEGAFGVGYADRLTDLFEGFQPMREFSKERQVTPIYAGNTLVASILDTWHEFGGTHLPRVAVVDWKEVATRTEFDVLCEQFQRHGVPARFVDPRELEYKNGALSAGGEVIDLVYRRLLTSELLAREDEVRPLLDAYKAHVVCIVNSFRAKFLDKKVLFALLQDPQVAATFTPEERAVVAAHVPWTRRLTEERTPGPDGVSVDLVPWVASHRGELVIKPNDNGEGRGVVIGANVEQGVWERALKLGLVDPSIVQQRIPLPTSMFPEVGAAGELFFSRRYIEVDPYLFRGEFRGVLTRLAATTLCNVQAGAGTVPTFIIEDEA